MSPQNACRVRTLVKSASGLSRMLQSLNKSKEWAHSNLARPEWAHSNLVRPIWAQVALSRLSNSNVDFRHFENGLTITVMWSYAS